MAHTEKDDNHLMEGTEDSAGMKHVHSVPMRMPWKRHLGRQRCDLLLALGLSISRSHSGSCASGQATDQCD